MVRIASRSHRVVLSTRATRAAPTTAPPRVRMCVSWRTVLLGLVCFYAAVTVMAMFTLDKLRPSIQSNGIISNDPLGVFQNDLSKMAQRVENGMEKMDTEFLGWPDQDNFIDPDQAAIVTSVTEIKHLGQVEQKLLLKFPGRNPQLCRRLLVDPGVELTRNSLALGTIGRPQYAVDVLSSCHVVNATKEYYFYNPFKQDRHVCGVRVPALGVRRISNDMWHADTPPELCVQTSHLYEVLPDASAGSLKPVVVQDNSPKCTGTVFTDCDVPCQSCGRDGLITSRTIQGTPFSFTFSMEGESYYPKLKIDPRDWSNDHYYATTAFNSDIPLPYFSFAEYDIQHGNEPVDYDKAIKGALFLARNCQSRNNREDLVKRLQELSSTFRIDSVSNCLHNAEIPNGVSRHDKTKLMRQYLFYLAFENQDTRDYVTEKLWGAFVAGVVPVYKGSPNIKEHVPENSVVFVNDFASAGALSSHLRKVAADRELYNSYHAWRYKPLPPHFMQKYNMTKTHNVCRTCRWTYAKQYGLGWSHEQQQLTGLQIPRHSCLNDDNLLTWPVRERWFQSTDNDDEMDKNVPHSPVACSSTQNLPWTDNQKVAEHWERTIHEHDGVIDLKVRPTHQSKAAISKEDQLKHPVVVELVVPFPNDGAKTLEFRQIEPGYLQWQNSTARVSVLIQPPENTPTRRSNAVTVQIRHPTAVRIIVEDVDRFHVGASKSPSYFLRTMKEEWENPLEIFTVEAAK